MTKKTKKILIGILSLLLIYFGYELYLNLTLIEKPGYYDFERSNIQEKIVDDKKVLTEKNLGITMQIPKDWEYEKYWDGLVVKDPDLNVESVIKDYNDWTQGCSIGISVSNDKNMNGVSTFDDDFNKLKFFEDGDDGYCDFDHCEIIEISKIKALKEIKELKPEGFDGELKYIFIEIPDNKTKRVYRMESFLSTQVPECQEHLNDFINNLEIK